MNIEQYLLQKLQEELNECGAPVSKAITFGIYDRHPKRLMTNYDCLAMETMDVWVVLSLMEELDIMPLFAVMVPRAKELLDYFLRKKVKLIYYIFVSRDLGRVVLEPDLCEKLKAISERSLNDANALKIESPYKVEIPHE